MAGIAALTDKNFDETVQKGGIVIIDFWATWCAPCKKFAPVFEKVAKKHGDVVFARVDVDADEQLADDFDIEGIPTVVAIRDGVVVGAEEGAMPAAVLEEFIAQVRALDMDDVRATLALEEEQEAEAAEAPKKAKKSAPAKKPAPKKPSKKAAAAEVAAKVAAKVAAEVATRVAKKVATKVVSRKPAKKVAK